MAIGDIVQDLNNLIIHEITIIGKNNQKYKIFPDASTFSYVSLAITEGLFEASVIGRLIIRDINSTSEQINFGGFEDIIIKIESPDIPDSYKSLKFKVYNVKSVGDQIEGNNIDPKSNITSIKLEILFTSYEHYLLNYKEFEPIAGLTGADIISPIATSEDSDTEIIGLVNLLESRYFKTGKDSSTTQQPMFIEGTYNWIWYKQNQLMYPWSKLNRPIKVSQLMQYLAENAVSETNQYACNFLFWQDLDRWNFRSIESLLSEPLARVYISSSFPTKTRNIYDLQIINESNYLRLFESNAFSGKYYLVEPKWDEPYREYLDYNDSHTIKEIDYDYFRDYNKWKKVEKYPLIDTDVKTKPTVSNIVTDNLSGYFEPSYANRQKQVAWEHHGYTFTNRDGSNTWQPMFDQIELDGEICRIIQKEVKEVIKDKKAEYARKKNLKEKWKVYRCSVCCDDTYFDETGITAGIVFSQEYGIAAAGGFTDVVNFKLGATGSTGTFPLGLTFSYDIHTGPYSEIIGDILHLRETPDLQTKYLYDLELKRIDIAEELLQKTVTRLQNGIDVIESLPTCSCLVFESPICEYYEQGAPYLRGMCDNGSDYICKCPGERVDEAIEEFQKKIQNINALINTDYFSKMREIVQTEKQKFTEIYEKYRNRKAFFVSKELGFTADNTRQTPLNVKSVTRIPIRGSKYEKLAHKRVLPELLKGISGSNFSFKGFPTGTTNYYPYDVFYDDDSSISPKEKHPYYDSRYNMDVGYNAIPKYSIFEQIGGPNANAPLGIGTDSIGSGLIRFGISFSIKEDKTTTAKIWQYNQNQPPGQFNYCNGSFSTNSYNYTNQESTYYTSFDPNELTEEGLLQSMVAYYANALRVQLENTLNIVGEVQITTTPTSITGFVEYKSGICESKINSTRVFVQLSITKIESNNQNNQNLPPGVVSINPIGIERLPDFNVAEYLNSRNLIDLEVPEGEEPKKPTENILEELESYVRIEFVRPIGLNTLLDFPSGFYDKPGSEYYLPYHVLLTSGPFGAKSTDYNISVLGQDPYGFDVAVKRIKKKTHNLNPDKKALVNFKDYHILSPLYSRVLSYIQDYNLYSSGFYNGAFDLERENGTYGVDTFYGEVPVPATPTNYTTGLFDVFNIQARGSLRYTNPFGNSSLSVDEPLKDQTAIRRQLNFTEFNNRQSYASTNIVPSSELYYYDLLYRVTRKNPLSLPESYFELSNIRTPGVRSVASTNDSTYLGAYHSRDNAQLWKRLDSGGVENTIASFSEIILAPGNVFSWVKYKQNDIFPIDTNYFKSNAGYNPNDSFNVARTAFFEMEIKDRNIREGNEPENETSFYGFYSGSCVWKHPAVDGVDLSDEEIQKSVWKNDISGESEYGVVSLELNEQDSIFDRNFAAQFIVVGPLSVGDENNPCSGYPCSNPNPVSNIGCPPDDPTCNCPCQELRPDKLSIGITGPEPTYQELKLLEEEIKECNLIEDKLGEEWLGCAWTDPKNPLNCNCPCIGEKFLEYLKYSQTYCTFWKTPPERPLLRNAQMMQINANKIVIKVNGDLTMRPGMVVNVSYGDKRFSGNWLVSQINHDFGKNKHYMTMVLIRDSEYLNHEVRAKELILNTDKP